MQHRSVFVTGSAELPFSTEYVFRGDLDRPEAATVYGVSKLAGEIFRLAGKTQPIRPCMMTIGFPRPAPRSANSRQEKRSGIVPHAAPEGCKGYFCTAPISLFPA